jgi:UDP-glucose 4-epimerase
MSKKKVFITGGFGFIGGRLGQHLYENGYEILLGSRAQRSTPNWLSEANVLQIDWNNQESLDSACNEVDVVLHASGMNAKLCAEDPKQAYFVNGIYTERLVKAAVQNKVKKFIYFSTSHVYSAPLTGQIDENSLTVNLHPYATSHLKGECSVLKETNNEFTEGVVVRLSNAFGAPTHKEVNCWMLLINDLCRQAVSTKKLILKSSGEQIRDFVAIADVYNAIKYLIEDSIISRDNVIINIGSGRSRTLFEIAQNIQTFYTELYGTTPLIESPISTENLNSDFLYYKMNYLDKRNYKITDTFDNEMKKLLIFCKNTFCNYSR